MRTSSERLIVDGGAAQLTGRIAVLLAAGCPVLLVFLMEGATAALWTAVTVSAGLWAVADLLARRGPTTSLRVLRARKIELVTADDRVVVALGETVDGKGAVALYDRSGECIERVDESGRSPQAQMPSALGPGSPFAFGFGIDRAHERDQPRGFAVSRNPRSRLESAGQKRRRIAAERRSQVLGAIELSCSPRAASGTNAAQAARRQAKSPRGV